MNLLFLWVLSYYLTYRRGKKKKLQCLLFCRSSVLLKMMAWWSVTRQERVEMDGQRSDRWWEAFTCVCGDLAVIESWFCMVTRVVLWLGHSSSEVLLFRHVQIWMWESRLSSKSSELNPPYPIFNVTVFVIFSHLLQCLSSLISFSHASFIFFPSLFPLKSFVQPRFFHFLFS